MLKRKNKIDPTIKSDIESKIIYWENADVDEAKRQRMLNHYNNELESGQYDLLEKGGSIKDKKGKILQFINKFPDKPISWTEATDELTELHYRLAEEYGLDDYEFDFNKRYNLSERNIVHKKGISYLLKNLNDKKINNVYNHYSSWFEYEKGGEIWI